MLMLSPRTIGKVLIAVTCTFLLAYMATQLTGYSTDHSRLFGLTHLFNLDEENNISTWFCSLLLSTCALLLALIGVQKKREAAPYSIHWLSLAVIFLILSVDETASMHDLTSPLLRQTLDISEGSYFWEAWVVLGGCFVLIIGVSSIRLLTILPHRTKWLFMLAGSVYVGGAMGMEMVRATTYPYDPTTLRYILGGLAEEGMEMMGVAIFVYALFSYLASEIGEIRLIFLDRSQRTGSRPVIWQDSTSFSWSQNCSDCQRPVSMASRAHDP